MGYQLRVSEHIVHDVVYLRHFSWYSRTLSTRNGHRLRDFGFPWILQNNIIVRKLDNSRNYSKWIKDFITLGGGGGFLVPSFNSFRILAARSASIFSAFCISSMAQLSVHKIQKVSQIEIEAKNKYPAIVPFG